MVALYLSRLVLEMRSREVRRDLADCHRLHQRLLTAFPTASGQDARSSFGVLYRLEGPPVALHPTLLVQAVVAPDWAGLPAGYLASAFDGSDNPACKRIDERYARLAVADKLAFRLRANPTRRVPASHMSANRLAGKRVALLREEEQLAWLRRKAEAGGFALLAVHAQASDERPLELAPVVDGPVPAVRTMPAPEQFGFRPLAAREGRARLTFGAVLFEGHLRVTDAEAFRRTLAAGIGSGKAYGFGLLSIASAGGER